MSTKCPLCGNKKADDSLFCKDCTEKLNNEYEVDVPASENKTGANSKANKKNNIIPSEEIHSSDSNQLSSEDVEQKDSEKSGQLSKVEERRKNVDAPNFDKRAWKKQKVDKRSDSNKSYYELSTKKKSNKAIGIIILVVLLIAAIAGGLYYYNNSVKSNNIERSAWELAHRDNTVESYLDYMALYPQGTYFSDAYSNMLKLKEIEAGKFEHLLTSENRSDFTDFIDQYPRSPYTRVVKSRFDSLMWQSALNENRVDAYSNYITMADSQKITGDFIGEAQKRFKMLNQDTAIDGGDLELIKRALDSVFVGVSTMSYDILTEHIAPVLVRYKDQGNISREQMISLLLLKLKKEDAESIRLEPEMANLKYEKMNNGTFKVNVPVQKVFEREGEEKSRIKGYIVHLSLNSSFKIYSYYETKPYSEAP